MFAVLIVNKTCIVDIHGSGDEATKRSLRALGNSGTRFKGQVSSVTRRECNVIAARSSKKDTPSRRMHTFLAPRCSRRNLSAECVARGKCVEMFTEPVWESVYFSAASISQQRPTMKCVWRPKGRCDAMGTARGMPVHPAKTLNRKNATAGPDSISIGISFGYNAIQSLSAVRSPQEAALALT